jgi:glutamyl-tRNA synthetase
MATTENRKVRVRFAPSPTGALHLGGVRTALYNYLFAKKHGGDFILRIEDTDQTRFVPGAEAYIIEALTWCGICPNEGIGFGEGKHAPYRQSDRKEAGIYKKYVEQLLQDGHAYYAFDTPEELEEMRERLKRAKVAAPQYNHITRQNMKNSLSLPVEDVQKRLAAGEPYVVRMKIPKNQELRFHDEIRGWIVVNTDNLDDKVLYKSDGMPTYHLANIVDDYLMEITHVIRGEEWLPSLPLHVFMYQCFGWADKMPKFAHLPLILKPDGNGKLSKRDGDRLGFPVFPLQWQDPETGEISSGYREKGYFPDAFINMMALLGWHPGGNVDILSREEAINLFSLERVGKSGAKFDVEKTLWYNQQYLRMYSDEALGLMLAKELEKRNISFTATEKLPQIASLMKERAHFVADLFEPFFFTADFAYDTEAIAKKVKENSKEVMQKLRLSLENVNTWTADNIETQFKSFIASENISQGEAMPLFRFSLTGRSSGASLFVIASILGKEETINRLNTGLNIIFTEINK